MMKDMGLGYRVDEELARKMNRIGVKNGKRTLRTEKQMFNNLNRKSTKQLKETKRYCWLNKTMNNMLFGVGEKTVKEINQILERRGEL